ncbi:hypothetical protein QWY31_03480 [Cytophagales bacterium LB-30]|uniref:Uncharacterized protein n=1 Tax=Shiella aurantiaca TaxID=3058365 RepID=A0ABT8F2T2_9BACT|nr:hypothetical protein [Shiella aurantiaca]MDN4164546.1 hypothetical protein [Shiella aurantiaca]
MKHLIVLLLGLTLSLSSYAQLSTYQFDGQKVMRLALFYGSLTNEWSGKIEDESHSTVVFDWSRTRSTFGWGKYQASHRFKILGDVISSLYTGGILHKTPPGTPYLSSFLGWHNFALSALYTKHAQVSLGLHAGDYLYGIHGLHPDRDSDQNTSGTRYYYGGFGPAWMADVALGKSGFFIHYEGSYAFTVGEEPLAVAPDVKPRILNQMFELRFRKLFFNVEVVYGLNDWGNRIKRQQFGIGVQI